MRTLDDLFIDDIACFAGVKREVAEEILDIDYTYWCDRGDTTKEEHLGWLATAPMQEIANWVRSIANDMTD